jgi:acetoin utilization deacetylase AcuC-like enzyme
MNSVGISYDDFFLEHDTGFSHPESRNRFSNLPELFNRVKNEKLACFYTPRPAVKEEVLAAHSKDYIDRVKRLSETGTLNYIDVDTVVGPGSYDVALLSAGASLTLIERMMDGEIEAGFAIVRPPGHHAVRTNGMGFCIFNNAVIAANFAKRKMGIKKIAIFDWDVHHGNGVQDAFYDQDQVLYASIHQYPHYPGTGYFDEIGTDKGEGYTINVPVPAGSSDLHYLMAFDDVFLPILQQYEPELIIVCAGYDAHETDPLSSINLKHLTFQKMAYGLLVLADKLCSGRLLATLEGGYDPGELTKGIKATLYGFNYVKPEDEEAVKERFSGTSFEEYLKKIKAYLGKYWKL